MVYNYVFIDSQQGYLENIRKRFWAYKVFNKKKYDILFLGDSRVYRGLSPKPFIEDKRKAVFNFGFSSAILDSFYLSEARKRVKEGAVYFIGVTLNSIKQGENKQFKTIQEKYKGVSISSSFKEGFLRYFIPFRERFINHNVKPKEIFYDEMGWVASGYQNDDIQKTLKSYDKNFSTQGATEDDLKRVENLLCSFEPNNKVFIFLFPADKRVIDIEEKYSQVNYQNLEEAFLRKCPHRYIEIPEELKAKLRFYDGSHLDEKSSIILSRYLLSFVKK